MWSSVIYCLNYALVYFFIDDTRGWNEGQFIMPQDILVLNKLPRCEDGKKNFQTDSIHIIILLLSYCTLKILVTEKPEIIFKFFSKISSFFCFIITMVILRNLQKEIRRQLRKEVPKIFIIYLV